MEILTIQFKNNLTFDEVPFFRGALLHSIPPDKNLLLHNHQNSGYRYSYPLVQYKSINGKATVVCLNEGIDSLMQLIKIENLQIKIGHKKNELLLIDQIFPRRIETVINCHHNSYRIMKWIALNSENYVRYIELQRLSDRIAFLERILTANILSFFKGVNIHIDNELDCHILDISDKYTIKTNKDIRMMAFDASFQINVELPDYIGLGKHTSLGYGLIVKKNI